MDKQKVLTGVKIFLVIYYLVGLVGLSLESSRTFFSDLVPLSLLLSAGLLLYFQAGWNRRRIVVYLLVFLAGYFVEVLGVKTGLVFGEYLYGPALGPGWLGTPFIIGLNWFVLAYCAYEIFKGKGSVYLTAFLGACLMVMYDIVLEPVAVHFYWWLWVFGAIPLQNFIAWMLVSYLMILLMHQSRSESRNPLAMFLFIVQFLFFMILNITL